MVSIIMPTYNAEKYLEQAIESVRAQTYANWELLIVNDGSIDSTQSIIDFFCNKDSRIKSFYQQNGKQGKARNLAISHSKGEYLAFLDADDLWVPDKLEIQLQEINETKVDLIFAKSFLIDSLDNTSNEISFMHEGCLEDSEGIGIMIEKNRIPILTVLVKKQKVLEVGNFTEDPAISNAEDYHLWLKLIMNKNIFWGSDKILSYYRVYESSSTGSDKIAIRKLPYVYADLIGLYPEYADRLQGRIKNTFNYLYKHTVGDKADLYPLLRSNCLLLNKRYWLIPLYIVTLLNPISRARYLIKKYLNA
jgi:glycosyltransferase involved in cell wall biosynthesis